MTTGSYPTSSASRGIVWIASYPRSGNTWTRHFLNNLLSVVEGRGDEPADINAIDERTIWDIPARRFEEVLGKGLKTAMRAEIAAARAEVQRRIAEAADGAALVKTHNALLLDRGHPTINFKVTAGALYIVRDPRDVAISFAHHFGINIDTAITRMGQPGVETDVNEGVAYEVYGSWSEHVESWTRNPHRAILVVRYEDMLREPERTFAAIARHLQIAASPEQVRRAIELSAFAEAQRQEAAHGYRERPKESKVFFRTGRAGQWRETLTREQVDRIFADHSEQMARYGYVPNQ